MILWPKKKVTVGQVSSGDDGGLLVTVGVAPQLLGGHALYTYK